MTRPMTTAEVAHATRLQPRTIRQYAQYGDRFGRARQPTSAECRRYGWPPNAWLFDRASVAREIRLRAAAKRADQKARRGAR